MCRGFNCDFNRYSIWLLIGILWNVTCLIFTFSNCFVRTGDTRSFFCVGAIEHAPSQQPETFSRFATQHIMIWINCAPLSQGRNQLVFWDFPSTFVPWNEKEIMRQAFFSYIGGMKREKNFSFPHSFKVLITYFVLQKFDVMVNKQILQRTFYQHRTLF